MPQNLKDKVILNYFLEQNISMNKPSACDTKQNYFQLNNALQFRVDRIKEIEDFFYCISMTEKR